MMFLRSIKSRLVVLILGFSILFILTSFLYIRYKIELEASNSADNSIFSTFNYVVGELGQCNSQSALEGIDAWISCNADLGNLDGVSIYTDGGDLIFQSSIWKPDQNFPSLLDGRLPATLLGTEVGADVPIATFVEAVPGDTIGLAGEMVLISVSRPFIDPEKFASDAAFLFLDDTGYIFAFLVFVLFGSIFATIHSTAAGLRRLSEQAQNITTIRSEARLLIDNVPSELRPLVSAMNDALDRLANGYETERAFASLSAHELRTPLAIVRTQLQRVSDASVRSSLATNVDRMDRLIEQLLMLGRARASVSQDGMMVPLSTAIKRALEYLAIAVADSGGDVELKEVESNGILVDQILLEMILKNILENAVRHSPPPVHIQVSIVADGFVVVDNGVGIDDRILRHGAIQMFRHSPSGRGIGAGLGLTVIYEASRAVGAEFEIKRAERGGTSAGVSWKHL